MTATGYLARNTVHIGDVRELAGRLEANSVQCIVTSPPYYGLRDYGTATWEGGSADCDHRQETCHQKQGASSQRAGRSNVEAQRNENFRGTCAKCGAARVDRQLGMEATPEEFVANLVAVFAALRPALKDDGTLWLNLGDSYANDTKWGGATGGKHAAGVHGATGVGRQKVSTGVPPKSLLMIPHRVALALQADRWVIRQDNVWAKVNPMPESVTDRTTRAHEFVFHIAKNPKYFCDMEAIKEPQSEGTFLRFGNGKAPRKTNPKAIEAEAGRVLANSSFKDATPAAILPNGRNKRSVWSVPGAQFPDAHYATFPPDLIRPCILAGSRPGDLVLDPFLGSGTVAEVAVEEGRRWIGFDLDERARRWTTDRLARLPVGRLAGL